MIETGKAFETYRWQIYLISVIIIICKPAVVRFGDYISNSYSNRPVQKSNIAAMDIFTPSYFFYWRVKSLFE